MYSIKLWKKCVVKRVNFKIKKYIQIVFIVGITKV